MAEAEKKKSFLDHIVTGIGYMLPCVVAGGILMGLGYMFDDATINPANYGHNTVVASFFSTTGSAMFGMMLPVLAAGIGYSIGGVSAIAAGLAWRLSVCIRQLRISGHSGGRLHCRLYHPDSGAAV